MSTTETSSAQRVRIEVDDHVATVVMTRGDRHNALDEHMFRALIEATERLRAESGVRVVVLHGAGPSFCSGLDVPSFMDGEGMAIGDLLRRDPGHDANWAQRAAVDWQRVPAPVIAAIHGACFGGGIQIALGADVRVCAPDARLSVMESTWGLIPDMGITRTLTRLVRADVAKELTFSARVLSGEEAHALGLVTELADDPVARAHELARAWAQRSPDALRLGKRLYEEAWTLERAASLLLEETFQRELFGTPNQLEAVRAGLAKEPPSFT
jgi:enoyl-CoA hydratase/carnithine racemase